MRRRSKTSSRSSPSELQQQNLSKQLDALKAAREDRDRQRARLRRPRLLRRPRRPLRLRRPPPRPQPNDQEGGAPIAHPTAALHGLMRSRVKATVRDRAHFVGHRGETSAVGPSADNGGATCSSDFRSASTRRARPRCRAAASISAAPSTIAAEHQLARAGRDEGAEEPRRSDTADGRPEREENCDRQCPQL